MLFNENSGGQHPTPSHLGRWEKHECGTREDIKVGGTPFFAREVGGNLVDFAQGKRFCQIDTYGKVGRINILIGSGSGFPSLLFSKK